MSRQVILISPTAVYPTLQDMVAVWFNVVPPGVEAFPLSGDGSPQSENEENRQNGYFKTAMSCYVLII